MSSWTFARESLRVASVARETDSASYGMRTTWAQAFSQVHGETQVMIEYSSGGTTSFQVARGLHKCTGTPACYMMRAFSPIRDAPRPLHSVLAFCVQRADRTSDHNYCHSPDAELFTTQRRAKAHALLGAFVHSLQDECSSSLALSVFPVCHGVTVPASGLQERRLSLAEGARSESGEIALSCSRCGAHCPLSSNNRFLWCQG